MSAEARIEHVSLNARAAYNDGCENAVLASGLTATNLHESNGDGVGVTITGFDDVDIYGEVRSVNDLTICDTARLFDSTPKYPPTWTQGLEGFEVRDALNPLLGATYIGATLSDVVTGQEPCDVLTSADDITDTLGATSSAEQLVVGTGVLYWVQLPAATALLVGTRKVIVNATPEFIGVKNSDSTTWHRVPPRAKCVCYLLDNSTAAGVWFSEVIESNDPADGLNAFCDMLFTVEALPLQTLTGATGSTGVSASTDGERQGKRFFGVSAVADWSLGCIYASAGTIAMGAGCRAFELSGYISALSDAAQEFILRAGFGNNVAGGAHTSGVYFLYDRAAHGDVYVIRNIDGAGDTTLVTAAVPSTSYKKLRVEIASDASRSDFWVEKTQLSPAGGLVGHIPANGILSGVFGMTKTVGANARYLYVDFVRAQSFPTTRR